MDRMAKFFASRTVNIFTGLCIGGAAIFVTGMIAGAGCAHNFATASSTLTQFAANSVNSIGGYQ